MKKTNAIRILESLNVPYKLREFSIDESDLSAENAALRLELPVDQVFKTLVVRGDRSGVVVVSIPGGRELDLKAFARVSGNKKVEMVSLKEVQPLTGYIRGAVSPLGLKNNYEYYLDENAFQFDSVIISAGTRGVQIEITPEDLKKAASAVTGSFVR
ncbi:MAG: Cys-tRNA(Pro) deacylase [Bacillota bacterium]|nr:Cys-tRNA(Pro) deacylase [Bacillota bacterium]